jgi:hypothetical protein
MTDDASEFTSGEFEAAAGHLKARHIFIRAGRALGTILDECWKPALARYLIPKYAGLRHDPEGYCATTTPTAATTDGTPKADPRRRDRQGGDVVALGMMRRHYSVTGQSRGPCRVQALLFLGAVSLKVGRWPSPRGPRCSRGRSL